jgi:hypothetical protein
MDEFVATHIAIGCVPLFLRHIHERSGNEGSDEKVYLSRSELIQRRKDWLHGMAARIEQRTSIE